MTCKYFFKGREFQSEEELNDFLLDTETTKPILGDVVYSITSRLRHYSKLLADTLEEYKNLRKLNIQINSIYEAEEVEPEDLDDVGKLKLPYISVTDLIHSMPGRYTDLVFPIFRSDEYWKLQFDKYRNGIFDNYELLFISDLLTPSPGGGYEAVNDDVTLNKIRDRIEGVLVLGTRKNGLWKLQAVCGNFVHEIFACFYRDYITYKDSEGREKRKYLYKSSENEIVNYLKKSLGAEYRSFISDELILSVVKQCLLLDKEIRLDGNFGENAYIRAEQPIVGNLAFLFDENQKATKIIGKIDLLVIGDENHQDKIGIIDFKCSPKDYTTSNIDNDPMYYNSAKILTFKYQLAVYRRILKEITGGGAKLIDLYVVPLKFEDFKMENGKVSFSGISSLKDSGGTMLLKLSNSDAGGEYSNIEGNLDRVFPKREYLKTSIETLDVVTTTKKVMDKWFPIKEKDTTLEGIKTYIEEHGGVKFDDQNGKYYFKPSKTSDNGMIIKEASSPEAATVKIIEEIKKRNEYNLNFPINTAESMRKEFINFYSGNGDNPIERLERNFGSRSSISKRNSHYIRSLLEKYTNTDVWKPVPTDTTDPIVATLDLFGILLFENKQTHLIEVVRISGLYNPASRVHLSKGNYILGAYLNDLLAHNSAESLTMVSTSGNIELIETMLVLNQMKDILKGVGLVKLLCPSQKTGLEVPNELLLYNFNRLCLLEPDLIENNFYTGSNDGSIKMATYLDILKLDFEEIKGKSDKYGLNNLDRDFKNAVSKLDWKGKTNEQIKDDLLKLDLKLIEHYGDEITLNIKSKNDDSDPQFKLHKDILYAISELSGVKMVQLLEESKKLDANIAGPQIGLGGTMIDNPGTLLSTILNQATNLVTIAYQNTRDAVLEFDMKLREKVKRLKKKKGFNWISQNITGNQVKDLYYNMFDHKSSDVKFVNPWDPAVANTLEEEEIDFLKFAIIKINATRNNKLDLKKLLDNPDLMGDLIKNNEDYLKVPLVKGDRASEIAVRGGIANLIRDRFSKLNIFNRETRKKIREKLEDNATKLVSTEQSEAIHKGDLWEAINTMDDLDRDDERRERVLTRRGKEYFEHNLETLLLKQHSAYTMAEELNKVFPIIQSLMIHLNSLGAVLNKEFLNDIQYLVDYIKTKVHNQPMEDRNTLEATLRNIFNEGMKWASRLALSFNLRQMYLFLDGIWLDIKLFIKQPDGTLAFTKDNLIWAWKFVMGDLFHHYGDDRSITELLNIKYGINDMDMNTYIDRIKSDSTGLFTHFWDTGFRFASRPDYYNRMTIFIAQMRADGSFEAHSIKDGKLTYDWTKDRRFKAFAENSPNKEEYNKAKAAYIALARLLVEEGARNEDGSLFVMDILHPEKNPLPKAYSNRESESRKALSDRIYGYYAHEKKSMFNSTFVGALTMQMNTYWSAKKNQWIQLKSYTQEGYYTDYEEDGLKYFWKINESTGQLEQTTEDTGLPVQVWKGRPLEGIAITAGNLCRAFKGDYEGLENTGLKGVKELLNGDNIDPDLRRLYHANLRLLFYDLFMLLFLGVFASSILHSGQKAFAKDHPNKNLGSALANTAINLGVGMIDSSADDFKFYKSIFGRGVLWTPFSFTTALNVLNLYKNFIGGNLDFLDAVIKTSAATRGTVPIWECVKLNTVGRKIGQTASEVEKK